MSNLIPIVIAVATALFVAVKMRSRGGRPPARLTSLGHNTGHSTGHSTGQEAQPLRLLPLPGDVGLVAAREFRERVRGRAFRLGTLLLLVAVGAAVAVPALLGARAAVVRVGVAGTLSGPARAAVTADGHAAGAVVDLVAEPSASAATADVRAGRVALALIDGSRVVVARPVPAGDSAPAARLTEAVARTLGTGQAMAAAGLTPAQATAVARARPLPVSALGPPGPGTTQRNAAYVGLIVLFFMLAQYNAWTLTGVIEEKASRVAEVLLAALPPGRLLAGKVLGIGLAAFLQAALAVATAATAARATHSSALNGLTALTLAATLTWLVLGYAFYAWVYAAAGSTADRQEQAQSLLVPLGLPVIFGSLMAGTAVLSGSASALVRVLAYLPPTAPFAMPALVSLGAATWWQFALSAAASAACTVAVARVAIAVYQRSILRAGRRPRLRDLFAG